MLVEKQRSRLSDGDCDLWTLPGDYSRKIWYTSAQGIRMVCAHVHRNNSTRIIAFPISSSPIPQQAVFITTGTSSVIFFSSPVSFRLRRLSYFRCILFVFITPCFGYLLFVLMDSLKAASGFSSFCCRDNYEQSAVQVFWNLLDPTSMGNDIQK